MRVNGKLVCKAHYRVRVGQVLTFPGARAVYVVQSEAWGYGVAHSRNTKIIHKGVTPQSSVRIAENHRLVVSRHFDPLYEGHFVSFRLGNYRL